MKLKKNDLISLKKAGAKAIVSEIAKLKTTLAATKLGGQGSSKLIRRSLSQLLTIRKELQS